MNNRIARKIVQGRTTLGQVWNRSQYDEAHRQVGQGALRAAGVHGVHPRTSSALAVYGGKFLKTSTGEHLYLLDLDAQCALLPVFKTARQERAVREAVRQHAAAGRTLGREVDVSTLAVAIINDPAAFLRICPKQWEGWPICIAVDFVLDGARMYHTTVTFTQEAA